MGQPVALAGLVVKQGDDIPLAAGQIIIRLGGIDNQGHGVRLKARGGWIELSDGRRAEVVDTWRAPGLPDVITYTVSCPSGGLLLWNIYQVTHPNGEITEDMWTGNAGMTLLSARPNGRTYGCSPGGGGDFEPRRLIVEVEWRAA